ncbi:hypothetical protein [Pannonibacter phragmitetus]|nr:hypothetical protein [Pannonibacter phragmitetus]
MTKAEGFSHDGGVVIGEAAGLRKTAQGRSAGSDTLPPHTLRHAMA